METVLTLGFIIAVIVSIISLKRCSNEPPKTNSKKRYPFNGTDQEKVAWVCEQNQKKIDKIMRKYK